jgi:hypothetical protein
MAAEGHSPEEWLDQHVAVIISEMQEAVRIIGRLVEFSELGISLAIPLDDEGQSAEETVFYPWHVVSWLRLAREDEQPG